MKKAPNSNIQHPVKINSRHQHPSSRETALCRFAVLFAAVFFAMQVWAAQAPAQAERPGTNVSVTTTIVVTNAAAAGATADTNLVLMNFHGAPLEQVLTHLSKTAGFIINIRPGTTLRGKVDAWSEQPMTKEEALNLLDTSLDQNGLAAIRNQRTLTIVDKKEAKTQHVPVISGSD